ncbi:MAG: hypothetical protein GY749_06955, partial [Desulfobacteraceae bacterium]|nr:hypothetical protein [Desulfobacteraceae bacterium]
ISDKTGGYDSTATLKFIESAELPAYTNFEQYMADLSLISDKTGGYDSTATLKFIESAELPAYTNFEQYMADLSLISDKTGGYASKATVSMLSKLSNEGVPWADIQTTMENYGVKDQILIKTVQSAYTGEITFDELKLMTEGAMPEKVDIDVAQKLSGDVTADLKENENLTFLNSINRYLALIEDGLNVTVVNFNDMTQFVPKSTEVWWGYPQQVNINTMPPITAPGAATGMLGVPHDNMLTYLHQGELVIQKRHAPFVYGTMSAAGLTSSYPVNNMPKASVPSFRTGLLTSAVPTGGEFTGSDNRRIEQLLTQILEVQKQNRELLENLYFTTKMKETKTEIRIDGDGMNQRAYEYMQDRKDRGLD